MTSDYSKFKARLAASGCRLCRLCDGRTQIVVDRGNPEAKIMVIGEAPGRHEDEQGRAFVGRAGQSFDAMMAAAGMETEKDMLIANVVKCRPPENRPPRPDEAAACRPYLLEQLALVKPRAVILLGATALRHLQPDKKKFSMKEEAGKFFESPEFPGVSFAVFYHPAALFYNAALRPAMEAHARALKKFLDGTSAP